MGHRTAVVFGGEDLSTRPNLAARVVLRSRLMCQARTRQMEASTGVEARLSDLSQNEQRDCCDRYGQ